MTILVTGAAGFIGRRLATAILFVVAACVAPVRNAVSGPDRPPVVRPNILLIVADDLGYSDLGAWGGEIQTPELDRLAARGIRYSNFHAGPTCSPTRAMLMTGVDHHRAGLGTMAEALRFNPEQRGRPGYEGHLNDRVVTIAQLLKGAGYSTLMAGKWHLGYEAPDQPPARGFERSYALLPGGAQHFDGTKAVHFDADDTLREDGRVVQWPVGRFSSDYFTDRMIGYLREAPADRPFFAYVAFTAPHWPLQAPDESLRKYAGRYSSGWDAIRAERIARMRTLGLIHAASAVAPRPTSVPEWSAQTPEQRKRAERLMEIYAAMIDNLDGNVGRLLAELERSGRDRDTVIIFMSDNGAEAMVPEGASLPGLKEWIGQNFDNRLENLGKQGSYVGYGPAWAHVSNTPSRSFKGTAYEGGTRVPAFIVLPGGDSRWVSDYANVLDLPPTLLQLAGVPAPAGTYAGRSVHAMEGRSLLTVDGRPVPADPERSAATELFGHRGVRHGTLKGVSMWRGREGSGPWQLFDLAADPGEQRNLATERPQDVAELARFYEQWSTANGVVQPSREAPVYALE